MLLSMHRGAHANPPVEGFLNWTVLAVEATYKNVDDNTFRPFYDVEMLDKRDLETVRIELILRYESAKEHHILEFNHGTRQREGELQEDSMWKLHRLFLAAGVGTLIPTDLIGQAVTFFTIKVDSNNELTYELLLSELAGNDYAPKAKMLDAVRMGRLLPHKTSQYSQVANEAQPAFRKAAAVGG